jgi:hypothetical protein
LGTAHFSFPRAGPRAPTLIISLSLLLPTGAHVSGGSHLPCSSSCRADRVHCGRAAVGRGAAHRSAPDPSPCSSSTWYPPLPDTRPHLLFSPRRSEEHCPSPLSTIFFPRSPFHSASEHSASSSVPQCYLSMPPAAWVIPPSPETHRHTAADPPLGELHPRRLFPPRLDLALPNSFLSIHMTRQSTSSATTCLHRHRMPPHHTAPTAPPARRYFG